MITNEAVSIPLATIDTGNNQNWFLIAKSKL